jgi:N-acetylglucosaminyl-diphospho-decaprenol L-rhamnosyltransferase
MNVLIVLNYNDSDTTINFLNETIKIPSVDQIIVVDNHSTDNSVNRIKVSLGPRTQLIVTEKNGGYAYGNNYGCRYAIKKYKPDFLFVANPDIALRDECIKSVLDVYKEKTDAAVVSCLMENTSSINIRTAWRLPKYTDCLFECLIGLDRFIKNPIEYARDYLTKSDKTVSVGVVAGSFFCIKTSVYEKIDGFDNDTFLYYEENILGRKLQKIGLKNYITCKESYIHQHSVSIDKNIKSIRMKLKIQEKSREVYCKKYLNCNIVQLFIIKLLHLIGEGAYLLHLGFIN